MMAYSLANNRTSLQSDANFSTPMFGSAADSAWTWRTASSPHTKHGPQRRRPPSSTVLSSPQLRGAGNPVDEFHQCVFIRYYTVRLDLGIFPRVIRAGAGPHDLGPGENKGDTFTELTVRSGTQSISDNEDPGGQWDPTTNDTGSERDMVIRNVPYVRLFVCSFISL